MKESQKGSINILLIAVIVVLAGAVIYLILPYSWTIENACWPVAYPGFPIVIRNLHDGTFVYRNSDGTLWRGKENMCR